MTLMGLGAFPRRRPACRWTCWACTAASTRTGPSATVICCWRFGVRFDDRVTGKLEAFAKHAKIVHIDIDPSELNKNKPAHYPDCQRREVRPGAN